MKNKKIKEATPVIETKDYEKGSVGEFIALLNEFPEDAKITLDGNVKIDSELFPDNSSITIYPNEESFKEDNPKVCEESYEDAVMKEYLLGKVYHDNNFINALRNLNSDNILEVHMMVPNKSELDFESR